MRFPSFAVLLASLSVCGVSPWITTAAAQDSLADLEAFRNGSQALIDGRFEAAANEFLESWDALDSTKAGDLEKDLVVARLLESWVRNGQTEDAILWVRENPLTSPSRKTLRWFAYALQAAKEYPRAADVFSQIDLGGGNVGPEIQIRHALSLALANQAELALERLQTPPVAPETSAQWLNLARALGISGQPAKALDALDQFSEMVEPGSPSISVLRLQLASLLALNREGEARERLYKMIDSATAPEELRLLFRMMEEVGVNRDDEELRARLEDWRNQSDHPAAAASEYYQNAWLADEDTAIDYLKRLATVDPPQAFTLEARARLEERMPPDGLDWSVTPQSSQVDLGLEERLLFLSSRDAFINQEFDRAARQFMSLAARDSGENQLRHTYNAALAALRDGDFQSFQAASTRLKEIQPDSSLIANLKYLGGLLLAAQGDPNAFEQLQAFIRDHPNHEFNIEARLALAEIHLNQVPARPQAAREIFEDLRVRPLTLRQNERLDYTAIWVELIDARVPAVIELGEAFLKDWPKSNYYPEVGMLLGLKLYESKQLNHARKVFLSICASFPDSSYKESAIFMAAKSAPGEKIAIDEWNSLAASKSRFAEEARHELGLLLLSIDRFSEAREQFQRLVDNPETESEMRWAAMADIGFAFYMEALAENQDPELLEKSAEAFLALSSQSSAPASWRYNAAVRRATCLEALGRTKVALEIFKSLVEQEDDESSILDREAPVSETEWIFRAGFSAIRILGEKQDWEAAIQIADALSKKGGSRSIEATELAEKMRLKHWIWD
ncbi:MAG: hypothetical protein AAGA96_00525 [Verrucomicrobiota bacterium]